VTNENEPPQPATVPGSCLCGGVRFELESPFELASYCHCENCRKQTSTFGVISMKVPRERLRLLSGEELLKSWQPEPGTVIRVFCGRCGSGIYSMEAPDSEVVWVRMGVLDADPGLRPSRHTWVRSAPAWLPVPEDGLPRYDHRSTG
jgi:hypothetical protein